MKLLVLFKKIFSYIFFLPLAVIARGFKFVGNLLLIFSSNLIYIRSGNFFFKDFKTDLILKKKIKFKNYEIFARVNNFWDYWRTKNFETYPVDIILKDLKEYFKQNRQIHYYEIGANVGYSSIFISKILKDTGESFAFEIDPTNFKTFNDNIILNNLKNLTPFNIGISSENKISKFYYNTKFSNNKFNLPASSMGMHSLNFNQDLHKKEVYCLSPLLKFSDVLRLFNLPKPTHLFIDAYGAEKTIIDSILQCDKKLYPDVIMVDIEEKVNSIQDSQIFKILKLNNYVLINHDLEFGNQEVPNSYKSVFRKQ